MTERLEQLQNQLTEAMCHENDAGEVTFTECPQCEWKGSRVTFAEVCPPQVLNQSGALPNI